MIQVHIWDNIFQDTNATTQIIELPILPPTGTNPYFPIHPHCYSPNPPIKVGGTCTFPLVSFKTVGVSVHP